jgi:hypothetical protein
MYHLTDADHEGAQDGADGGKDFAILARKLRAPSEARRRSWLVAMGHLSTSSPAIFHDRQASILHRRR